MSHASKETEELLRDATALVERLSLQTPDWPDHVVVGFRSNGSASIFFGEDPVYQFNNKHELRRSYWRGQRIKSESGKLFALVPEPDVSRLRFVGRDFDEGQTHGYLAELTGRLEQLRTALANGNVQVVGQMPPDHDLLPRVITWIEALPATPAIAHSPRIQ